MALGGFLLIGEVLVGSRHTNRSVALLIESGMISAPAEAVVTENQINGELGKVTLAHSFCEGGHVRDVLNNSQVHQYVECPLGSFQQEISLPVRDSVRGLIRSHIDPRQGETLD